MNTLLLCALKRALAGVTAGVLTLSVVVLEAPVASAAVSDRLAGANRYATAGRIATATHPAGADDVVLATGQNYPDALAAAGLAGALDAPVLLTDGGALSPETVATLDVLDPQTVHLVGGTAAVAIAVESKLDARGYATPRYQGGNRFETAAEIARAIRPGGIADHTAIVTTGETFADAVVAGPLAAAGPHPVLLVEDDRVPAATRSALTELGITDVIVIGGTTVVRDEVVTELAALTGDDEVVRLGGANRAETAVQVAEHAIAEAGFSAATVLIANGWQNLGVDALAGGPYGGQTRSPILFVAEGQSPPATTEFLRRHAAAIDTVRAFGGTAVVGADLLADVVATATPESGETNATLTLTPTTASSVPVGTPREFTVANAVAGTEHTIALVEPSQVTVSAGGTVAFTEDGVGRADAGGTDGGLLTVNGVSTSGRPLIATSSPAAGSLTFTVIADAAASFLPVVFIDADADGVLDLDEDGLPREAFGIGGRTDWLPTEAADNEPLSGTVVGVGSGFATVDPDPQGGDDTVTVFFRSADTHRMLEGSFCTAVDPERFTQELSIGDRLSTVLDAAGTPGPYRTGGGSVYCLEDLSPTAPTGLTATVVGHDTVTLAWSAATPADGYSVYAHAQPCSATRDEDWSPVAETAITQSDVMDLTAATDHCFGVRTVSGPDRSDITAIDVRTLDTPDTTRPILVSAAVTADNDLVGVVSGTDSWTLQFSERLQEQLSTNGRLLAADVDGDEVLVECDLRVNSDDGWTSATCEKSEIDEVETLVVSLREHPEVANDVGNGTVTYPLTIVSHANFTDGTNTLDLDSSLDVEID